MIDVIATNLKDGRVANIQVKTRSKDNTQGWVLTKKAEERTTFKNLFYVLVNLKELEELPDYYIIPYNVFAEHISSTHQSWLTGTSKTGKKRGIIY